MNDANGRPPRLAFLLLPGLDHFAHDLIAGLPAASGREVQPFLTRGPQDLGAALTWTDNPAADAVWFEFCWPPFPRLIRETEFGSRRVIVRVHRIEAYESNAAAETPWEKVDDVVVVSTDMARRLRNAAPEIDLMTRLHVIHNGLDLDRFCPTSEWNPYRIGWCGLLTLRKNPTLALQVLFSLRRFDKRYTLHVCGRGGDPIAFDSYRHLARRLQLDSAVCFHGMVSTTEMPGWHGRNGVLLSTSVHESFGYAICEAAAVGCDLAVLDYVGADEMWPAAGLFGSVDEAVQLIRQAAPHRWREHVAERFSLPRQLSSVSAMLSGGDKPDRLS